MTFVDEFLHETLTHGEVLVPIALYLNRRIDSEYPNLYTHWHDEVELCVVTSGVMRVTIGQTSFDVHTGDCFMINRNELHGIERIGESSATYDAILFHPSLLQSHTFDFFQQQLEPLFKHHYSFPQRITLIDTHWQALQIQLTRIFRVYLANQDWQLLAKATIFELVATLTHEQLWLEASHKATDPQSAMIKNVIAYMQTHLMNKIYLAELAEVANLSQEYFCRCFKNYTGMTAVDYLNRLRIETASQLLTTTNLTILEISSSVGIENLSYFNKLFKLHKNQPPGLYRKKTSTP